jgi:hypothetical protein
VLLVAVLKPSAEKFKVCVTPDSREFRKSDLNVFKWAAQAWPMGWTFVSVNAAVNLT